MTRFPYNSTFKLRLLGLLSFLFIVVLSGCDDKSPSAKSTDKLIKTFSFEASKNDALTADAVGVIDGTAITVTVPTSSVTALVPTITYDGASVSPASGVAQDFSSAVTYTVTAEDGSTQAYTVTVVMPTPTSKSITSFFFLADDNSLIEQDIEGTVGSGAIAVRVPAGVSRAALVPTIVHNGANISPASGVPQDFSSAVTYTVTAEDGSTQAYTVTIVMPTPTSKSITSFFFLANDNSSIDQDIEGTVGSSTVTARVPAGVSRDALVPTIVHNGASISPASGASQNFTNPVTYTVTAEDNSEQEYVITVTEAIPSSKRLLTFSFLASNNTLLKADKEVMVTGTDIAISVATTGVTALVPTITHDGASVSPASGVPQDFSSTVTYTVTADDASTQAYTVTVTSEDNFVAIPDAAFRGKLKALSTLSADVFNADDMLNANHVDVQTLDTLDVSNPDGTSSSSPDRISSLQGLEHFVSLRLLDCSINRLTALDVSNNTALQSLACPYNRLTALDVSNNTALQLLNCYNNSLTALDVSNHILLQTLGCGENKLTSVDVSNNPALRRLECGKTGISTLDLSNNTSLQYLQCPSTSLTTLNLSSHPALDTLYCHNSPLTTLNLSGATALKSIRCDNVTSLDTLDLSLNLLLDSLRCLEMRALEVLDIRHFTAPNKLRIAGSTGALTSLTVNDALKDNGLIANIKTARCNELTIQVFANGSITDTDYRPTGTAATCAATP